MNIFHLFRANLRSSHLETALRCMESANFQDGLDYIGPMDPVNNSAILSLSKLQDLRLTPLRISLRYSYQVSRLQVEKYLT